MQLIKDNARDPCVDGAVPQCNHITYPGCDSLIVLQDVTIGENWVINCRLINRLTQNIDLNFSRGHKYTNLRNNRI